MHFMALLDISLIMPTYLFIFNIILPPFSFYSFLILLRLLGSVNLFLIFTGHFLTAPSQESPQNHTLLPWLRR